MNTLFKQKSVFKHKRLLSALTGVTEKEFESLLPVFEQSVLEDKKLRSKAEKRGFGGGKTGKFVTTEDKLFFVLVYAKTYPTFDFLGFIFGIHRSKAHDNVVKLLGSLEKTLGRKLVMPEKKINSMEEFLEKFPEVKDLFVDGVERPIERPRTKKRAGNIQVRRNDMHVSLLLE